MPLTDTAIKNAKASEKPCKLSDEKGLYLLVTPSGGKWWRLKFRFEGKEKLLSLGIYPEISLKDARQRRDDARKLLANGIDPGDNRKAVKALKAERAGNKPTVEELLLSRCGDSDTKIAVDLSNGASQSQISARESSGDANTNSYPLPSRKRSSETTTRPHRLQ